MEATATRDPTLRVSPAVLLREPLFWAASAAFVGGALGLVGTSAQVSVQASLGVSYTPSMPTVLFAEAAQLSGEALAALSLLGVGALLGAGLRTAGRLANGVGVVVLLLLLAAVATSVFYSTYWNMVDRLVAVVPAPSPALETATFFAILFLPSVVALPFAVAAFWGREARLGALLLGLCVLNVPFGVISLKLFPPDPHTLYYEPSVTPVLFGWYGAGVSLPEAPLWVLLGVALFRGAREHVLGKASRAREKENLRAARRLYEEGLGRGDLSVVDGLASEDFRDLRHGSRGRLGMERALTRLRASFPDLAVRVEGQEAEGDLVRTRLKLSGTDRGGVLWYPPTGRRAAFSATFEDRFSGGKLLEHGGSTDTEGLLRQLGHHEGGRPGKAHS